MSKINSNRKGKTGELELCHILNEMFGTSCRRSQQFCGTAGDADIVGLEGIHVECKRVEKLNIDKAMEQAKSDCKNGDVPAVFHRKNSKPWKVTVELEYIKELVDKINKIMKRR